MRHLVDIVLPTSRRPHTVGYAIRAILNQSYSSFALHVVGDGCGRETEDLVRGIDDPRVRFHAFAKARGAATVHINTILRRTSAPYIAYATDDDLWFPDHLELGIQELERGGEAIVAVRPAAVRYPDEIDPYPFPFDWEWEPWRSVFRHRFVGLESFLHRREALNAAGYFNESIRRFNDNEFYNRVRQSSCGGRYLDRVTVLRFHARHWDAHYASLLDPPQRAYGERLQDPAWCAALRREAAERRRSLSVRRRQLIDFAALASRSGLPFLHNYVLGLVTKRETSCASR